MKGLLATATTLLAVFAAACGPSSGPGLESDGPRHPPGTVMVLNGFPLTEKAIDSIALPLAELRPGSTFPQHRRLALVRVIFPNLVARSIDRKGWLEARGLSRALQPEDLVAGPFPGAVSEVREGTWHSLGMHIGPASFGMQTGEWRGPIEVPGAYVHVHLEQRTAGSSPLEDVLRLQIVAHRYLASEAETGVGRIMQGAELEILDPVWREIVPEYWQYAMKRPGERSEE